MDGIYDSGLNRQGMDVVGIVLGVCFLQKIQSCFLIVILQNDSVYGRVLIIFCIIIMNAIIFCEINVL